MLILLYPDRWGDLRVVITMRAASLRSFSGHAALPGGKADSTDETPCTNQPPPLPPPRVPLCTRDSTDPGAFARCRPNRQERSLGGNWPPEDDYGLPKPFRIEQLCTLPPALARTHLVVTPCVALLRADRQRPGAGGPDESSVVVEDTMIPKLDAREVAAVFTAPFYNFLKEHDLPVHEGQEPLPPGHWYDGSWIKWKDIPWKVHNFHVPVNNQRVSTPRRRGSLQAAATAAAAEGKAGLGGEDEPSERYKVWGMTARVLVDAARVAYGEAPEMEFNEELGDGDIIMIAAEEGQFEEQTAAPTKGDEERGKI